MLVNPCNETFNSMKTIQKAIAGFIFLIIFSAGAISQMDSAVKTRLVVSYSRVMVTSVPPSLQLDTFYKKYTDAFGIPMAVPLQ